MAVIRHATSLAIVFLSGVAFAQNSLPTPASEAEAAYSSGDFAKCIELTTKAIEADESDHVALYLRASARVELGQIQRDPKLVRDGIEDSRKSLKALGKLEGKYYLPYLYGMATLAQLEDHPAYADTAIEIADTLLQRESIPPEQRANISYQRAVANLVRQKPDEAIKDYQTAIRIFPGHLGAHVGLAESYAQANQPEKAEDAYTAAVQTFPENPLVYNNRGLFLQRRGKPKEAIADFTKAIELDPKFQVAITNRGFTALNMGRFAEAEADFNLALEVDPNVPLPYSLRGTCRLSLGDIDAALKDYRQVEALDPKNPIAHADIGFARLFAKDYAAAHAEFEQALKMDPNLRILVPWRLWTGLLAGRNDAPEKVRDVADKPANQRDWLDHLVLYILGDETEQQFLAATKAKEPSLETAQLCEAYYFIAEKKALAGNRAAAESAYRQALATKAINLSAYRGAQFALGQFPK